MIHREQQEESQVRGKIDLILQSFPKSWEMCTSTLPFSIPQNRESGKRISTLVQTRNTKWGGDSAPSRQKETGGGERKLPPAENLQLPWEEKRGNVPRASARHFASGHVEKWRRREKGCPERDSQELPPLLLSEDLESWSFLFHFFPLGGHFSTFNPDKEGAQGPVSTSQSYCLARSRPYFGPRPGPEKWPSGTLKLLGGGGGVVKLFSNHDGRSRFAYVMLIWTSRSASRPPGGSGRARAWRRWIH